MISKPRGSSNGRREAANGAKFLFEKKEPKNFYVLRFRTVPVIAIARQKPGNKNFLLLFFQKRSACLCLPAFARWHSFYFF